jgi:hypothetical protein
VQGLCPRTPRIYCLVPLPMLGLLRMDEKGDAEASPFRSVESTESAVASQCGAMGTWAKRGRN